MCTNFNRPWIVAAALIILTYCCGVPGAIAQDLPGIRIIGLFGFDPMTGKRITTTQFSWPVNRQVAALVRYETSNYSKRKSVEVFWEISNRDGQQISKFSETYQVHAGKHEAALPVTFNLNEMFGNSLLNYKVEVKLVGGERLIKNEQFTLVGPAMPAIDFVDLKITADAGSDDELGPGSRFEFSGRLKVSGNTSARPPSLVVWALMADDTLSDDPWDRDPFSDLYWDWTQLAKADGDWKFRIGGRLPEKFSFGSSTTRTFDLFAVVSFADRPVSRTSVTGQLRGVNEELVSFDLDDRLIRLERNWDWELTELNQPQDAPIWPGQK